MNKHQKLIAHLAFADLYHEWILSICIILSLTAVLAPLLVLLGLKYGFIENMRIDLLEDPVNREIRPATTLNLPLEWFNKMQLNPQIQFVIPTILRGSSMVKVSIDNKQYQQIDVVPTAQNDPLLLDNQVAVPAKNEVVMSFSASEKLWSKVGNVLTLKITRNKNKRRQHVEVKLKISNILPPSADSLDRIYIDHQLVADIETYREGFAVTERQWQGNSPSPYLSYDGVWVLLKKKLTPLEKTTLKINTGFSQLKLIEIAEFTDKMGFNIPNPHFIYSLLSKSGIQYTNYRALKNKLRGKSAIIMPYINDNQVIDQNGLTVKIIGLSLSKQQSKQLGIPILPWGKLKRKIGKLQFLLPKNNQNNDFIFNLSNQQIKIPVDNIGQSFSLFPIVPVELLGIMKTAEERKVIYNQQQQNFILEKAGFRGFRLYTHSIDDIPELYHQLISQNIDVTANVREIEKVKFLDSGLTKIFWLVAIIGIIGAISALIASLYASVERKKKDISVLRLMGLNRASVFQFPIFQAMIISFFSVILAFISFKILATIINIIFSQELKTGQVICTLPSQYFFVSLLLALIVAILSSILAAIKTTKFDPSEALRDE